MADGLHQVGLAQTDAAVQEKRVVGAGRRLGHRQRRRAANRLFSPTTKDSNVLRGLRQPRESRSALGAARGSSFEPARISAEHPGLTARPAPSGNGNDRDAFAPAHATRWPSIAANNFLQSNTDKCCCPNSKSASCWRSYAHARDGTNGSRHQPRQPVAIQGISMPKFQLDRQSGLGYSQVIQIRGAKERGEKMEFQRHLVEITRMTRCSWLNILKNTPKRSWLKFRPVNISFLRSYSPHLTPRSVLDFSFRFSTFTFLSCGKGKLITR
jgi:hypothetical protein